MSLNNNTTPSSSSPSSSSYISQTNKTSLVKNVLVNTRKDLWSVQLIKPLALVFDPLRYYMIDPCFNFTTIILPLLTSIIPGADIVVSNLIKLLFIPFRYIYRYILPKQKQQQDIDVTMRQNAKNDILYGNNNNNNGLMPKLLYRPPSDFKSAIQGGVAFMFSAGADLISAIMDSQKMNKWFDALRQFNTYLTKSGVGDELQEAMVKPLMYGRLLDNVKILNSIQNMHNISRHERTVVVTAENSDDDDNKKEEEEEKKKNMDDEIKKGKRIMRFATAAYGTEMIKSAIDKEATEEEMADEKKAIAFHCDIDEDDVRLLYVQDGGDMKTLRHFVAIDHKTKSVILALRGTLSISGALVDMQAMDCEFCQCRAHRGIAEMANNIWEKSGDFINKLFEDEKEELKDYSFIITGHSLGAGTACLLNIKCHVEELVKGNHEVFCYAFAPPPVYHPGGDEAIMQRSLDSRTAAIDKAIANSVCYIHDNDCIPHLSVASIRRLANLLDTVDNITEHMWFTRRFKIFWEWEEIPQELIDAVSKADKDMVLRRQSQVAMASGKKMRQVEGERKMIIPARLVVWMKNIKNNTNDGNNNNKFEAFGCNPNEVSNLNIFLCEDMVSDHLPEMYEDALDALVE